MLKLHLVRISPCCRIVWLYCLQNNLPVELIDVDVFGGEHLTEEFRKMNPHSEVPVLVDGDVNVFEASAILLYLAEKYTQFNRFGDSAKEKAKVKSLIKWASTELHQSVGYRVVYPNFMEHYQLPDDGTETLIEHGTKEITKYLEMIENNYLTRFKYLTGDFPTVADYYIATVLVQLDWISFDFDLWPKISAWLKILRGMDQWNEVHEKHDGFVAELKKDN